VDYLYSARRAVLVGLFVFELLAGFTYSGFVPLMVALPAGAWVLKWIRENARPKYSYLALIMTVPVLLAAVTLLFINYRVGRDSSVADFNLREVLDGYALAIQRIAQAFGGLAHGFRSAYLPSLTCMAVASLLLGYLSRTRNGVPVADSRWLHVAVMGGLLFLAALSYLPYSLSTVRFADKRQLLMAGVFAYSAVMYLVLLALGAWARRPAVAAALITLTAVAVTLAGLEKREHLLDRYHGVEAVLAAVAAVVPNPAPHSFILVQVENALQLREFPAISSTERAFTVALQHLYGDDTLEGGFNAFGKHQVSFDSKGVLTYLNAPGKRPRKDRVYAGYDRLIVVYYPRRGPSRVLDQQWLLQKAGVAAPSVSYAPENLIRAGIGTSIACSFLEKDYRPAYCAHGVATKTAPDPATSGP
jgi:hypothetical protein